MWFNLIYSLKENQSFLRERNVDLQPRVEQRRQRRARTKQQQQQVSASNWRDFSSYTELRSEEILITICHYRSQLQLRLIWMTSFQKTPLVPLLETKHGLVVKVEKAQMIKSFKYVSDLYLNGWRGSMWTHLTGRLTFVRRGISCCWSLVLDWNAPYGSSQDAGSDNVQLSEIKTF